MAVASSSSLPSSFSTAPTSQWTYDVFISFRGDDTRNNFMSYLYEALREKGINTFRDDVKLEKGKFISIQLLKAIEESRFAIVILSENYATSSWCLDELAKIVACKEDTKMIVLPVFYYVNPSDVRKQLGTYKNAFNKHEQNENKKRVPEWRDALTQVGGLPGWHLENKRPELHDIQEIVRQISLNLIYDAIPYITKDLVGIDSRMKELEPYLDVGLIDIHFIGIWAMGGMGKTTLTRVVYYKYAKDFEASCFLDDVRENSIKYGIVTLQQKLLSEILLEPDLKIKNKYDGIAKISHRVRNKRILLVLDDVDELDQVKMLAGERNWFGPGSIIIITTRNVQVLKTLKVKGIYEVKELSDEDALELFCLKAFKTKHVPNGYSKLSNYFVNYSGGLPLALEILGPSLFGKSICAWKSLLKRLVKYPERKVINVLRISFDTLDDTEKEIFLHIACFFNHEEKNHAVKILDMLGLCPDFGLKVLVDKSLVKILDDRVLRMHDMLEEMGKNIIRQKYADQPWKYSRLWCGADIDRVLKEKKGGGEIQAIDMGRDIFRASNAQWHPEAFSEMGTLKFLRVRNMCIQDGPKHLPSNIIILDWTYYPSKSLPPSFKPSMLVQLRLRSSKIEGLGKEVEDFANLKFIDLAYSHNLIKTPDFTKAENLEKLVFKWCTNLNELHPSIGRLKKLILLDTRHCKKLIHLPRKFETKNLETLKLYGCSKVKEIPEFVRNTKHLQKLSLRCTAITELTSTIGYLTDLNILDLSHCKNLKCLQSTIFSLKSLKYLDLSGTAIKKLSLLVEHLIGLTYLALSGCQNIEFLPRTICSLKSLKHLDISQCSKVDNLPKNLGNIQGLEKLHLSGTAITELPSSIKDLTGLTSLTLRNCKNLMCLPNSICSLEKLEHLDLSECSKIDNLPENLGSAKGMIRLDLSGTAIKELPSSTERFFCNVLSLRNCRNLVSLPSIWSLKSLKCVQLYGCVKFENLPNNLGNAEGLKELEFDNMSIRELPLSIKHLTSLTSLQLLNLKNLVCLPSTIWSLKSLKLLRLCGCSNFDNFPKIVGDVKGLEMLSLSGTAIKTLPSSIEHLIGLTELCLEHCKSLVCLPSSIWSLKSLEKLDLDRCSKLDNLPEILGDVKGLKRLYLSETTIKELPSSIESLIGLTYLGLRGCKNLVSLPSTICSLKLLKYLELSECSKFDNLPQNLGNVEGLIDLDLSGTAIRKLPSSVEHLIGLTSLSLRDCKNLEHLLETICNLRSLKSLDLFGCSKLVNLPPNMRNIKSLEKLNLSKTAVTEVPHSIVLPKNLKKLYIQGFKKRSFSLYSRRPIPDPVRDSLLPASLSRMHSLTTLELSDCNLWEIPNNIGCLSSLEVLDLSGNCFASLPESISQLSELTVLALEGCNKLQSIANVPATIRYLVANYCTSLKRLPELHDDPEIPRVFHFEYLNCFKLVGNFQSVHKMLQVQIAEHRPRELNVTTPGSQIPKWFGPRNRGHKANIKVPSCGWDDVMGFALCVVFQPILRMRSNHQISCSFKVNGFLMEKPVARGIMGGYGEVKSHHRWLLYLSKIELLCNIDNIPEWERAWSHIEADGFAQIEIEISTQCLRVEKVGARLVYEEDMEELINTSTLCEDLDDSASESIKKKRRREEDDGDGPSGTGYSNDEPQLTRIEKLEEFMFDFEIHRNTIGDSESDQSEEFSESDQSEEFSKSDQSEEFSESDQSEEFSKSDQSEEFSESDPED